MFSIFRKKNTNEQLRRNLFDFLAEIENNLENFFVIDQRQFITRGFSMDVWPLVKEMDNIKKYESIGKYAKSLEDFNQSLKAHKEYEAWYIADAKNKTPENGRKLHALKHELDQKLKTMEAVIILAGQDLEREMLQLGLLKA